MKIGMKEDRVAIFDVDGTLMNIEHRRKYVTGEKKDWKSFFDYMEFDTINDNVFHLAHALHRDGYIIMVCSGRNEKHREITEKQLAFGKLKPQVLLMRADDDYRPDYEVKAEMLAKIKDSGFNPKIAVDDRPSVVKMWRDEGLTCFDVGGWDNG
jgi:FMN phosphatase YigB (HAD superfamily)